MVDSKVRCKENPQKWVIEGSHPDVTPTMSPTEVHSPTMDSDGQFSTLLNPRHKSADDAVHHIPAEQLDEEVVAHSELWKWVDAPVFVPRKPAVPLTIEPESSGGAVVVINRFVKGVVGAHYYRSLFVFEVLSVD